ncbi:MAG: Trk system potassium transporter TrkA [Waddliaceae bacterium]
MNIIIIGAGGIGRFVAKTLSENEHNVILIDNDPQKLELATWDIDVAVRKGSGTDWELLDDLLDLSPEYLIALTNNDEVNFVSCSIAKHLGYPNTIARVRDNRFLNKLRLDFGSIFNVDHFIGPEVLVSNEILKFIDAPGTFQINYFAHGGVQLTTFKIPSTWRKSEISLKELDLPKGIMVGVIARSTGKKQSMIFPRGSDTLQKGDEVTFIGESEIMMDLHHYLGIEKKSIKKAVIIGGSLVAMNLAKLLDERNVDTRIIEKDYHRCHWLSERLPNTTILHHSGTDLDYFRAEKVGDADVFVACTESDEANLVSALFGKKLGVDQVITTLSNPSFATVAKENGIDFNIFPRVTIANYVNTQVMSGTVSSLVTLYPDKAEVIEVVVSNRSKLTGIPLAELGPLFPKNMLISMIESRGRVMVAHGSRIISPGDTVIIITDPKHVSEVEAIF